MLPTMRKLLLFATFSFALLPICAPAQKPCEELKSEISKKLDDKGVKLYSLEIVPKDKEAEGKVVGTCEGGAKKIVYQRGATAEAKPAPEATKK